MGTSITEVYRVESILHRNQSLISDFRSTLVTQVQHFNSLLIKQYMFGHVYV